MRSPPANDTVYEVGSIAKAFTGTRRQGGYRSFISAIPEAKVGLVVLTNADSNPDRSG